MKDKVLVLASVASMIDQFNMPNIELLQSLDYEVHVACNFEKGSTCSQEKITELKNKLKKMNVNIYQIDFTRSVFNLKQDIIAYSQVKKIMIDNKYKFIHCHSPIGGVIGRLASKATKTKCIYTAHGFHFYKGAPLANWLIFYPVEKWLTRYTDILITINKEDYQFAKKKLKCNFVFQIPGVGINIEDFQENIEKREKYRDILNISEDDFLLLSVGELNENKNHRVIINALNILNNSHIHYCIVGQGAEEENLYNLITQYSLSDNIKLLGYQKDVAGFYNASDVFVFPSIREGLGLASIEAMANATPIIALSNRGTKEYTKTGITGLLVINNDANEFAKMINRLYENNKLVKQYGLEAKKISKNYSIENVNKEMKKIYREIDNI